jgi:hypothetical protein
MKNDHDESLLTLSSAARLAKKSEATIRQAEKHGRLPALRTATGVRLFKPSDVRAFAERLPVSTKPRGGVQE